MNIFYLDKDPRICAQYHCDKHFKMILESAQLLCTAIRIRGGIATKITAPNGKVKIVHLLPNETFYWNEKVIKGTIKYELVLSTGLYIQTHINHPCSIWVRENYSNWSYVYLLMLELQKEWRFRYRHTKQHKSIETLLGVDILDKAITYLGATPGKLTPPALAMSDYCKISSDPVECYREYYRKEKTHLHKWTRRDVPYWL